MDMQNLGYDLTLKEIDHHAKYELLEIAGLSGLGIDKVKYLIASGALPVDEQQRITGADFLNWVDANDLPVRTQP